MTNMQRGTSTGKSTYWWFGAVAGALVSSVVTSVVVTWEWLENPGGVFRSETGTNWQFILDTAISWFVPTFFCAAVAASVSRLAWSVVRKRQRQERR